MDSFEIAEERVYYLRSAETASGVRVLYRAHVGEFQGMGNLVALESYNEVKGSILIGYGMAVSISSGSPEWFKVHSALASNGIIKESHNGEDEK